ncbi:winged helix-turn-helix transcriptional regulator [Kitasatospora aureofaciens]|uniref:winged helix-turn-helix transcriptional regulator n=1 Tax=Kitasatospora aureofaciens TaxID=1894 RepID=UPI0037FF29FA
MTTQEQTRAGSETAQGVAQEAMEAAVTDGACGDACAEQALDIFAQLCPSRAMFAELVDKWSMLILMSLAACGPQRFSELQRGVGGVSRKMLTQSLRTLERDGLVRRTVYPETPPRVVYELLPLGGELAALLEPIGRWTERRTGQMVAARDEFDRVHDEA